jgi:NAD(P)-dependent dehydrogenase (short-subunit alcohol dehydrogenase family)
VEKYGRLDGAFNNAGIGSFGSLDTLSSEEYHKIISTNMDSIFYCLKYEIQQIKKQYKENPNEKAGYSIINCSSGMFSLLNKINIFEVVSLRSAPAFGHYSASKSGVDSLTRTAAIENGINPTIRVNSILPGKNNNIHFNCSDSVLGPIKTDVLAFTGLEFEVVAKGFIDNTLLKRAGRVEEIGKPVVFLLSDQSSYINGVQLPIDGGALVH